MPDPMTREEASEYAPQWGSYVRTGDPGACMYGDLEDRVTARLCLAHLPECEAIAHAGTCCEADGNPCEADLEELARLRLYLESVVRARFRVTYDIVTPESAEIGDYAEAGFVTPGGWKVPALSAGVNMRLREALDLFSAGAVEDSGRWLTESDARRDFETGAEERRALHPPEGITPASYARLKRLVGGGA